MITGDWLRAREAFADVGMTHRQPNIVLFFWEDPW